MSNADIQFARKYHEDTKHSEVSVRTSTHYLDWNNKPLPFKVYENLPLYPLPRDFPHPGGAALESLSSISSESLTTAFDVKGLAEILFFSAGLTRKVDYGGQTLYMRAASATGALYPIELHVVCGDVGQLGAGVYHHNPLDFGLVRLRKGDYRARLASLSEESVGTAPATICFTSFSWRNAWKYQARSYRHWFWDAGVIVANLLAVCSSSGLAARVVTGFVDSDVNVLLGVQDKEATVLLVPVGLGTKSGIEAPGQLNPIEAKVRQLSRMEVDYPEIWEMYDASSLRNVGEVGAWRRVDYASSPEEEVPGHVFPLSPLEPVHQPKANLGEVILRRGSTRSFASAPINFSQLSTILKASKAPIPFDFEKSLVDVYLIANNVEGLPAGSYFFDQGSALLRQLKRGEFRRLSAYLCLEQALFGQASVVFFLMSPLLQVLKAYGNRGYRVAQLEGGIRAGKIYLAAYSLGLGASGSTFYDDAVTDFFSPHAKGKATMIVVGIGVPAYRAKVGRVLPQFSLKQKG